MTTDDAHGVIRPTDDTKRNDYLFRISLKSLIRNDKGEVLVVKESGRNVWDLPGGGMDHDEDFKTAIARELKEEVNFDGDFTFKIIAFDEPHLLLRSKIWQVRLIFEVHPDNMNFSPGEEGDEVAFMPLSALKDLVDPAERAFRYANSSDSSYNV